MTQKKRALLLMAETGLGHLRAATAIQSAIESRYGDACEAVVVNVLAEENAPPFMRNAQSDYDRVVRDWPQLNELGFRLSDMALTSSLTEVAQALALYEATAGVLERYQPDVVVTTYPTYQAPLAAYVKLNRLPTPLVTVVTDLVTLHRLWFSRSVDLCLVPTQQAADLAIERGLAPERVRITGLPVDPKLSEPAGPKGAARAALGWDPDAFTLLAVASPRVPGMEAFVRSLNHAGFAIQLAVVAGGNDELYENMQRMEWHIPVHLYNFVEDLHALMRAADAVMAKAGGLIVTESLACGLPMLLIQAIPGQEEGNAEYVVGGSAGDRTEEPLALLEALCHWLLDDGRLYTERAKNARRLGRPDAAYRAADLVWELAQKEPEIARRDTLPDVEDLKSLLRSFGIHAER